MAGTTGNAIVGDGLPAGYREVIYWRLGAKRWRAVMLPLAAFLSLVPWLFFFGWLATRVGHIPQSGNLGTLEIVLIVAVCLLIVVLHELVHALAMRACGASPRFGVLYYGLMAYATAQGHAFSRSAYVAVALAPLVGLSLLALLAMIVLAGTPWVGLLAFCAAANAAGATGDLWMVRIALRYPSTARLMDERDGVRIFLPA